MADIQSTKHFGTFFRVIFRWRGSVWKCVSADLVFWLIAYYVVMAVYRFLLSPSGQNAFESISNYANKTDQYIPLSLLLGFFVKVVLDRWQGMFGHIGFIDKVAHTVSAVIRGADPETVTQRRNIVRYLCLVQLLVLRDISVPVRKRFPSLQSIIDAGILHAHELRLINAASNVQSTTNDFGIHWLPFHWACELCQRARQTGRISGDPLLAFLFSQLMQYRDHLQKLLNYDWVPIPVAYPQVVFCAVRFYFLVCLFSRQSLISDERLHTDAKPFFKAYLPLMTIVQFVFYMGWVKVAEELLNPLGEDDDDFETLFVLERNLHVSIALADQHHDQVPEQYRDTLDKRHDEWGTKTTLIIRV
uniref:Bestrophin homolog n=1 Tax=Globodera rostochiensis TaxID=31243 RepID=A0A914I020_GLORO